MSNLVSHWDWNNQGAIWGIFYSVFEVQKWRGEISSRTSQTSEKVLLSLTSTQTHIYRWQTVSTSRERQEANFHAFGLNSSSNHLKPTFTVLFTDSLQIVASVLELPKLLILPKFFKSSPWSSFVPLLPSCLDVKHSSAFVCTVSERQCAWYWIDPFPSGVQSFSGTHHIDSTMRRACYFNNSHRYFRVPTGP